MRVLLLLILCFATLGCSNPSLDSPSTPATISADRPSATRDGKTIRLRLNPASFDVPEDWVEWYEKSKNNFHLTHAQLDAIKNGGGEWDTEYAAVCNAVLPFDRCAAHLGEEGWGKNGVSYADLQVRVYELKEAPEAIEGRIAKDGVGAAKSFKQGKPELKQDATAKWRQTVVSYGLHYGDYGGTANVDFRIRQFGDWSYVFVLMYSSYHKQEVQEATIKKMLDSFSTK